VNNDDGSNWSNWFFLVLVTFWQIIHCILQTKTNKKCCGREAARCRSKIWYTYRNVQRHRTVLPALERHLVMFICGRFQFSHWRDSVVERPTAEAQWDGSGWPIAYNDYNVCGTASVCPAIHVMDILDYSDLNIHLHNTTLITLQLFLSFTKFQTWLPLVRELKACKLKRIKLIYRYTFSYCYKTLINLFITL